MLLEKLYSGNDLNFDESKELFSQALSGELYSEQTASLMIALKVKGESNVEIAGAASAMRTHSVVFPNSHHSISDCCGTGGDGLDTINVSTLVAFLSAYSGIKITKHGNRSVSSDCGSSDLLSALEIEVDLSPEDSATLLDETNFSFLFAPAYHLGLKPIMPIRKLLNTRTIFNLIGPLANPALPDIQLLGVYDEKYCYQFAEILKILGVKKALVVNGSGLDEIAIHDKSYLVELNDGKITDYRISPEELGLPLRNLDEIQVKGLSNKVALGLNVLKGDAPEAHIDLVAANAGALFYLNGLAPNLRTGVALAKENLLSGKVYDHVMKIKDCSKRLKSGGAHG